MTPAGWAPYPDDDDGPECPECGALGEPVDGLTPGRYRCRSCGREWTEDTDNND